MQVAWFLGRYQGGPGSQRAFKITGSDMLEELGPECELTIIEKISPPAPMLSTADSIFPRTWAQPSEKYSLHILGPKKYRVTVRLTP